MSSGRLLLNKTLIFASLKIYLDFDDVLSDRDDDASCGDGYVPGSKIEQEESPRNPGMVTFKRTTHCVPT